MKTCKFILAFLSTIIVFTACKKDSDNNTPKTKTELLAQGTWKFDNAKVSGTISSLIQACQKDNI